MKGSHLIALLALSVVQNANAAFDSYRLSVTYNPVLGVSSTFSGAFTLNTATNLVTALSGTLFDGDVHETLGLNFETLQSSYSPGGFGLPPASDATIDTGDYFFFEGGIDHEFVDIFHLAIVPTDPTEMWSLGANEVERYDITDGSPSAQLTVERYSITPEVPVVPEPSAWSMVAIGLTLVGAASISPKGRPYAAVEKTRVIDPQGL